MSQLGKYFDCTYKIQRYFGKVRSGKTASLDVQYASFSVRIQSRNMSKGEGWDTILNIAKAPSTAIFLVGHEIPRQFETGYFIL